MLAATKVLAAANGEDLMTVDMDEWMLQRVAAPQSLPLRHCPAGSLANNVENLATRAKRVYGLR